MLSVEVVSSEALSVTALSSEEAVFTLAGVSEVSTTGVLSALGLSAVLPSVPSAGASSSEGLAVSGVVVGLSDEVLSLAVLSAAAPSSLFTSVEVLAGSVSAVESGVMSSAEVSFEVVLSVTVAVTGSSEVLSLVVLSEGLSSVVVVSAGVCSEVACKSERQHMVAKCVRGLAYLLKCCRWQG